MTAYDKEANDRGLRRIEDAMWGSPDKDMLSSEELGRLEAAAKQYIKQYEEQAQKREIVE